MSTRECFDRAAAVLSLLVVALIALLATVTTIQFRWTRQLQQQYADSREELLWLQTKCLDDSHPDVSLMVIQEAIRKSVERIEASDSERRKRQIGSSLEQMLTDMMVSQEKVLMSNCLNSSKLCIPGHKGDPGVKGDRGISGNPGAKGEKGNQGPKGDTGPTGNNGTKGDMGPQGAPGVNGTQGLQGLQGLKGDRGPAGKQGPSGKQGPRGPQGDKGKLGMTGLVGHKGKPGTAGLKGEKGDTGLNGTKGDIGPRGPTGPTGTPSESNCACVIKPHIDVFEPNETTKFYPLGSHVSLKCGSTSSPNTVITWSGPLDGCVPASIQGGQLDIDSLQPAHVGNYTCTATNPFGTVSKTISIESNVTGALDCDFEDGKFCTWSNSRTDSLNWFNIAGHTPSTNTGPLHDHTLGNLIGHYAYVETSSGGKGSFAELVSAEMRSTSSMCFSFWYNMFGNQMGSMSVETEICNSSTPNSIHLHLAGNQGQAWHMAQIQLPAVHANHRIVIKGVRGSGIYSDMAVDDIKYYPGRCKSTLTRSGAPRQQVGFAVNSSLELGCDISGAPPPSYHWEKTGGCPITSKLEITNVAKHAAPGNAGTYVCTATSAGNSINTTFNVTYTGPSVLNCTFEDGPCGWTQPTTDNFDWLLNHGSTQSQDTGPTVDHTFNSTSGNYMFIEASSPRTLGDAAILQSYLMPGKQGACLSLAYHMYGVDTGSLRVLVEDSCTKRTSAVFTASGDKGNRWQHRTIPIPASAVPHDYYIQVKAEVGSSYHGDIAIDDLILTSGPCQNAG